MRPSFALNAQRDAIRKTVLRYRTVTPRVFGSVLHGTDRDGGDLDLLVDPLPGVTLFDLGGLQDELQSLLGIHVDLLTPDDLPPKLRNKILLEAQPIRTRTASLMSSTTWSRQRKMHAVLLMA